MVTIMNCILCGRNNIIGYIIIGSLSGHVEEGPVCDSCLTAVRRGYSTRSLYSAPDRNVYYIDDYLVLIDGEILKP